MPVAKIISNSVMFAIAVIILLAIVTLMIVKSAKRSYMEHTERSKRKYFAHPAGIACGKDATNPGGCIACLKGSGITGDKAYAACQTAWENTKCPVHPWSIKNLVMPDKDQVCLAKNPFPLYKS